MGVNFVENVGRLRFPDDTKVVKSGEFVPTFSRAADTPPWWAGAVIGGSVFAATDLLLSETKRLELSRQNTAVLRRQPILLGHWVARQRTLLLGKPKTPNITAVSDVMDAVWINTPALASPVIYDGGVGGTEFSKHVVGKHGVYPGMLLCVSGAFTGANCGTMSDRLTKSRP